jgi:toxin FitB
VIVLDTNVVSALMWSEPEPLVVAWLDGLPPESIWTTSITLFEGHLGLEILVVGRRRLQLEEAFAKALEEDFESRVLPFDQAAAQAAGRIAAEQCPACRTVEIRDAQIAGIVKACRAILATYNTRHFEGCGLMLVDPWSM